MLRLAEVRKELGISQRKLAILSEIDPSVMSRIEHGRQRPYEREKEAIVRSLHWLEWDGDAADLWEEI